MRVFIHASGYRSLLVLLLSVSLIAGFLGCSKDKPAEGANDPNEVTIAPEGEKPAPSTQAKALTAIDNGLAWLQKQQNEKGGFHIPVAMTALTVSAFLNHPDGTYTADTPFLKKALDYIASVQHPNGAIWDEADNMPPYENYNTSLSLVALSAAKNSRYDEAIQKGQQYITGIQVSDEDSIYYGGIGYGSDETTRDLSNLNIALQGLKESGLPENDPVWSRAVTFLEHVQSNQEVNKASWAGNDGGFVYMPGTEQSLDKISKAGLDDEGRAKSYASMTYAGLLSFIYANVDKDDERVQAAVQWIHDHYTLEENYGVGEQGLYYNYHTMAKALSVYGERKFTDSKGVEHDWYAELVDKLVSLQQADGYWRNEADRWMEFDPLLVTAYAVLALELGYSQ